MDKLKRIGEIAMEGIAALAFVIFLLIIGGGTSNAPDFDSPNPAYWRVTQGERTWWCVEYEVDNGHLHLLDGRIADLDGDFTAEQVHWQHLPKEEQRRMLPKYRPKPEVAP